MSPLTLDGAETMRRLAHLGTILFTHVALVSGPLLALVVLVGRARRAAEVREPLLFGVSLVFLTWFVGVDVAASWLAVSVAWWLVVEYVRPRALSMALLLALLGLVVVSPVHFVGLLAARGGFGREFVAFATNMAVLRAWAYAWDRWHGHPPLSLRQFVLTSVFFPTLVNGPVERPHATVAPWEVVDGPAIRAGLGRIVRGVVKMSVIALALPPAWTARLAGLPEMSWLALWATAGLLWIWFYASFSAWSDLAIGTARLCGRVAPENFDRPWRATEPADFWRRWHVSFGHWLRDYVYIPLGGSRRSRTRNVVVTFVVSALWHVWGTLKLLGLGYYPPVAWTGFLIWGLLHAGGVVVAPRLARRVAGGGTRGVWGAALATFVFAAFCWVPFFAPSGVTPYALLRTLGFMWFPFAP